MPKIAVDLSIFQNRVLTNLEGVLDRVLDAGYEGVETRLLPDHQSARGLRLHLEDRGLALAGLSVPFERLGDVSEAIDYLLEAGGRYLVATGPAEREEGAEAFQAMADALNQAGAAAAERGAALCYVNDLRDFAALDGTTGFQMLCDATDAEKVKLCPDTYSVAACGKDPSVFIHKHRKRIVGVHLTDGRPDQAHAGAAAFTELGIGALDILSIMKMAILSQPEWVTSAQSNSTLHPSESIRRSREYLREIGY